MQLNRRLVLFACVATLTGCERFISKPLSAASTAARFDARRLSTKHARWSLSKLTAQAMETNPDLAVLRARVQTAEGALKTAGERPNPVLSFKPGYNSSSRGISPWIIEPGLDITIETGGKREARMAEAVAKVRVARLELEAAAWRVRGDVRRALLAVARRASHPRAVSLARSRAGRGGAPARIAAQGRRSHAAGCRHRAHPAESNATLDARHRHAGRESARPTRRRGRRSGRRAHGSGFRLLRNHAGCPPPPRGGVARRHALTHRADILAALADYAASEERLRLEVAKQYPDLKLGPGYKLDQNENKWTLGIGFELPILNQHKGAIAEAEGKRAEAAARFVAVQARALAEIDVALAVYRAARGESRSRRRARHRRAGADESSPRR